MHTWLSFFIIFSITILKTNDIVCMELKKLKMGNIKETQQKKDATRNIAVGDVLITFVKDSNNFIEIVDSEIIMPLSIANLSEVVGAHIRNGQVPNTVLIPPMLINLRDIGLDKKAFDRILPLWQALAQKEPLQEKLKQLNYNATELYESITVADYLQIKPIVEVLCSAFASSITSLNEIENIIASEMPQQIDQCIAKYIIKNHHILENLVQQPKNIAASPLYTIKGHLYGTLYELGMHCMHINDNGFPMIFSSNKYILVNKNAFDRPFDRPFEYVPITTEDTYNQTACAISNDNRIAIIVGINNGKVLLDKVYIKEQTVVFHEKSDLTQLPLFVTLYDEDKKICVISGNVAYFYNNDTWFTSIGNIPAPSERVQRLFAHTYNNTNYVIIKCKDQHGYFMIDSDNLSSGWQKRETLEDHFDFDSIIAAYGSVNNFIKKATGFDRSSYENQELLLHLDAFNFYTYQMLAFVPISKTFNELEAKIFLIKVQEPLKKIIKIYNEQPINLNDALYMLAFKINNWQKGSNTIFEGQHSTPSLKEYFEIYPSMQTSATSASKKSIFKEILAKYIKGPAMWGAAAATISIIAKKMITDSNVPALAAGAIAIFGTSFAAANRMGAKKFYDPNVQKSSTLLKYISYGLGAGILGLGAYTFGYFNK